VRQIVFVTMLGCTLALAYALSAWGQSADDTSTTSTTTTTQADEWTPAKTQRVVDRYRRRTWHWQRIMGKPVTLTLRHPAQAQLRVAAWKRIAAYNERLALHPPHLRAWLCLHRFEGAWNDPNPPYYGGLQMDLGFQRAYGARLLARKGTADHWTPLEQMWVGERALRAGRGYWAWPNSARVCGLI
jgi:hypothetical protein